MEFSISIPADDDGYVLFQCPLCKELFKITPDDFHDDNVMEIYCPSCGLVNDNYLTEDVVELAIAKTKNYMNDLIFDKMKAMERKLNNGAVTFKAGKKPKPEYENQIDASIDNLIITKFSCCHHNAKVSQSLRISGCYCPFCGVRNDEFE
ncbi:TFIIB-type zinc ribbon-containing protein [Sphaerochaeta sp. PS]|uniref:TFIIB-type zinc ribbon-containing protein n=1 Tax=Sphaerochaeta sp. PS TaxID=3076336 RepID=UPI0028A53C91|nr:TFIIB-type zinc ribbon-containing protein [Sphaerochaeta sp. PS]MDT4761163.1 TFIIB-type zinc ribbon-containing protein [Sphaerochaeta sp. PS]